jgi:uncharacterized BrkB/YihY/UPF0761 family membrane protein
VFVAPRLVGVAAIYGTFVAAFALLAWLSIAFNLLLLGAAWTDVRVRDRERMPPLVRNFSRQGLGEAKRLADDAENAEPSMRRSEGRD